MTWRHGDLVVQPILHALEVMVLILRSLEMDTTIVAALQLLHGDSVSIP